MMSFGAGCGAALSIDRPDPVRRLSRRSGRFAFLAGLGEVLAGLGSSDKGVTKARARELRFRAQGQTRDLAPGNQFTYNLSSLSAVPKNRSPSRSIVRMHRIALA